MCCLFLRIFFTPTLDHQGPKVEGGKSTKIIISYMIHSCHWWPGHETYNTLLHCSIYKSGDTFLDTSLDWVARGFLPMPKIWNLVPANNGEKNYTPAVPKEMSVSETCSWRPLNSREVIVLWVCLFLLGLGIFWNFNATVLQGTGSF